MSVEVKSTYVYKCNICRKCSYMEKNHLPDNWCELQITCTKRTTDSLYYDNIPVELNLSPVKKKTVHVCEKCSADDTIKLYVTPKDFFKNGECDE